MITPEERANKILVTAMQWIQTHVLPPDEPETFTIFRIPMQARQVAADEIRAALAEAQRWIPVAERLPKDETKVICYPEYYKVHYENGDWWSGNYRIIYGVTHWQPLPAPPEEVRE